MIGRKLIGNSSGYPLQLTYDGKPEWKPGGATVDWGTIVAVSSDTVVSPEGYTVPNGGKYLGMGQVMTKITTAFAQTITMTGTPTGGSITIRVYRPDTGVRSTIVIPYNSTVAAIQTLFDAFYGAGNTTVSSAASAPLPGAVQTVTFGASLAGLIFPLWTLDLNSLTGGTNSTATFAVSAGSTNGYFGPYDSAASDGRQILTRGNVGVINEAIIKDGTLPGGFMTYNTDNIGIVTGGLIWKARLKATTGSASLAAGPTFATLETVLPRLGYALN